MPGPDLPPAHLPMTADAVLARWPTGAWKRELVNGVLYFYGEFDERDAAAAERMYEGRHALINQANDLEVHPAAPDPPRSVLGPDALEASARPLDSKSQHPPPQENRGGQGGT